MPKFSEYFALGVSQPSLDFVDIDSDKDIPVYVDPYAIELHDDEWAAFTSEHVRTFFEEVLSALKNNDITRAENLMSNLREPTETFLGVSKKGNTGRGVGGIQARQLINAIISSKAYLSGLLTDLSEMALYVDGIDRDKISDLTTNIIRKPLVEYTNLQCNLYNIETRNYNSPPMWDLSSRNWRSNYVKLPFINDKPILLVPKHIVRRKLSIDSQEFYNKQITDFLIEENLRLSSSLVQVLKGKQKVFKKDVREKYPKSKTLIADIVQAHPELLEAYKALVQKQPSLSVLDIDNDDTPSLSTVCNSLSKMYGEIEAGTEKAHIYHLLILASFNAIFYPSLIIPSKEHSVDGGRKRIDITYVNASEKGFFSHRRDDKNINANWVIVECKNYSEDLANAEIDQLIGRFTEDRGKLGIIACRSIVNQKALSERCKYAASHKQGYIIPLSDIDMINLLSMKANFKDEEIEALLHKKYRDLIS